MAFPSGIRRTFRFPWRTRTQIARDVDDELRFHLDMQIEALVARGMTRRAARREALRQFGDLDDTKRYCRTVDGAAEQKARRAMYLDELRQDLRYAVRGFITHPGLTAVTVLTIAIGIGATVAVYAVVYGVLLRPLHYTDPDALVLFHVERGRRGTTDHDQNEPVATGCRSHPRERPRVRVHRGVFHGALCAVGRRKLSARSWSRGV